VKIRWSALGPICREIAAVAGHNTACWVEDPEGTLVAGTPGPEAPLARYPVHLGGSLIAAACVTGAEADRWAALLATAAEREVGHQNTISNMADATAKLWKGTNSLQRMAAALRLNAEPAAVINEVLMMLRRATRLHPAVGLIRLPRADLYSVFQESGVDTMEPLALAPLYAVADELHLIDVTTATPELKQACARVLGTEGPAAVARLATDHDQFGFLLAPVEGTEPVTSEDLKMLGAAAKIASVAIKNACTLSEERETMRLHVENELLAAQANDMEEMLHIVAHDLRSPMTALYGFLHVALDDLKDMRSRLEGEGFAAVGPYADSIAEPMRDGIRSVEKLNRMVQRLLEYSRSARGAYAFERVDLEKLVRGVIRSLGYQLRKRAIDVQVGAIGAVTGDRVQLEALFGNLIDNAIKYMGEGASRTITIGVQNGPEMAYFVRDTGIGMTADEVSKAFLPFQRFHRNAAPGDGIGLPHVRKIVERHGGRIWCESQKGVGTTFFFTLGGPAPENRFAMAMEIKARQTAQEKSEAISSPGS
jgi:signal transduction histidine kinase